eukprot:13743651-Alexandrium_andersonii.AAC.1
MASRPPPIEALMFLAARLSFIAPVALSEDTAPMFRMSLLSLRQPCLRPRKSGRRARELLGC